MSDNRNVYLNNATSCNIMVDCKILYTISDELTNIILNIYIEIEIKMYTKL